MSDDAALKPARRFLHLCYCCADADEVTDFFVAGFGMRAFMRTPSEPSDGSLLGIDGEIESAASFVYDHRGPRTSPAIEIQSWVRPEVEGVPSLDPFEVGAKTFGFAVPDLAEAESRLTGLGCTVLTRGSSPFAATWTTVVDRRGMPIELVEDPSVGEGVSRMRHLRHTVADLDATMDFYADLGFTEIEAGTFTDASFAGHADPVEARYARLRLPDEPFEVILVQWISPASHGRHYAHANHAGLFRAALGVDDTRASYDAMTAAGAVFDRPPRSVELKGTPVPDMWITFISDPNGFPYEFVQRPRTAFR